MAVVKTAPAGTTNYSVIDQARWRVENGISTKLPAPRATIELGASVNVPPNDEIRIEENGQVIFDGFARSGEYGERGGQRINCRDDAYKILDEEVTVSLTNTTDSEVISTALGKTELSAYFTFAYNPTPISIDEYDPGEPRKLKVILKDMADRSGRVWQFDASHTLTIDALGGNGTWNNLATGSDPVRIESWKDGEINSVQNAVTVIGTNTSGVEQTETDATSISNYGRQSKTYRYRWVTSNTEASNLASELLIPNPLKSGKLMVSAKAGDIYQNLTNYNITLFDSTRSISSEVVAVEKQVIREGRTTLHVGQGAGYAESQINRDSQSGQDAIRQNYTQLEGTLDDIDDGANYGKIYQDAIQSGYHSLAKAVGVLDDIPDGTTYAKINQGNVDSDNYVLLAASRGSIDDVDDGGTYGKVKLTALNDGLIQLTEALGDFSSIDGDLDQIPDGTDYGKVDTTFLTPGNAVFAKGIELDDGQSLDSITAEDAAKANATVIDGGNILTGSISATEIEAGSISADEISSLELDTGQLSVGVNGANTLNFELTSNFATRMVPSTDGYGSIGSSDVDIGAVYTNSIYSDSLDAGGGQVSISGDMFLNTGTAQTLNIIDGGSGSPQIYANNDGYGILGDPSHRFYEVHTVNLYQGSPEPLDPNDPRVDALSDGGKPVDLDKFLKSNWGNPMAYSKQREKRDGSYETTDHDGLEIGHTLNLVWEAAKEIEQERRQLEERVDSLESRLSKLEAQVGE